MKDSPLTSILIGVVAFFTLAVAMLAWLNVRNTKEIQALRAQEARVNYDHMLVNALATDAVEYGKKNPAINPLLESIGVKLKAGVTNKPASK